MSRLKIKQNKRERAFTLIEMLIAVLIFSLSLASLMGISAKSLKTEKGAEDYTIADYLAIEGIETIHNLRDEALLNGLDDHTWLNVFQDSGNVIGDSSACINTSASDCDIYKNANGGVSIAPCSDCNVFLDKDNFYYYQLNENAHQSPGAGSILSKYRRKINIKKISDTEILVHSTVTWPGGKVRYGENLYLWQ